MTALGIPVSATWWYGPILFVYLKRRLTEKRLQYFNTYFPSKGVLIIIIDTEF
jgi:hypothetical protein